MAYENLKEEICCGELTPGTHMTIHRIAQRYGMSESPIREALKKLEAEGLITNRPHVGFIVTEPDFKDQENIFATRQLLETHATWLAASNIKQEKLEMLRDAIAKMKACEPSDAPTLADLNYQFHDIIYGSCGNPVLYQIIRQVAALTPRTKSIFYLEKSRIGSSIREHEEIYRHLADGNADAARTALREHKRRSYDILLSR